MPVPTARARLLDAAARLFYARGIGATGIDAITGEAGVAKQSLYNNFASKQELTRAYLDARHEEWLELFRRRSAAAPAPRERALAVFDAYLDHAHAARRGFRGCALLNAAAELPVGDAGRDDVRRHQEEVERILAEQLHEAGCGDPSGLAEHLSFVLEGAMSRAGLEAGPNRLRRAREIAEALLDAAIPTGR